VTSSEVYVGLGLLVVLAVGCQVLAHRLRLPAIVLLLPAGFAAGQLTSNVRSDRLFGVSFEAMVSLAVAVILFEGGLNLRASDLASHEQRVVRRLVIRGIVITWTLTGLAAALLLPVSDGVAVMLGAILVVSGPTVVGPLLRIAQPGERLTAILEWESTTIDPIGAILTAIVFQALHHGIGIRPGKEVLMFAVSVGFGVLGGLVGTALMWLLFEKLEIVGVLSTEAVIAVVVGVAAACNALRADTGLIAAITMGIVLANTSIVRSPEDRPFFRTIVELMIGLLFVSISATVTGDELVDVLGPAMILLAVLVLVVRPLVTAAATVGSDLTRYERVFIGLMCPRGIVAASTAATFAASLQADRIQGARVLLPVTFLVIVGTVTLYGLVAEPAARMLRLDPIGPAAGPDEPAEPPSSLDP
jgi:NhaP-type Na+/H+ or K+/H+ antiporter